MSLFKWMFRAQWDAIRRQGQELEAAEHKIRELQTCLVLAKDARAEWELRAVAAEDSATNPRPMSEAVQPSPFTLNPVDGTMGYVCILAAYNGELDEWVLHDDGAHYGWVVADLNEPDWLPASGGDESS